MIVLVSILAIANGQAIYQPFTGGMPPYSSGNVPYYSTGPVPGNPVYGYAPYGAYSPGVATQVVAAPGRRAPPPAPAPISPSEFDVYVARQNVNAEHVSVLGNQVLTNVKWSELFPTVPSINGGQFDFIANLGSAQQGVSAGRFEDITEQQIQQYKRTHPNPTQADINAVNDLKLSAEAAHQTKLRRAAQIVAPNLAPYYELQAHDASMVQARNSLDDAQAAYAKDPSEDTARAVQNAHGNIQYQRQRSQADQALLLGTKFSAGAIIGNGLRAHAAQTQLRITARDRNAAAADYAANPTEENRLKWKVAQLAFRAWQEDQASNKGFTFATFKGLSAAQKVFANIGAFQSNQNEEDLWGRYYKAQRQLVQYQRAQAIQKAGGAAAQPNSVQNRLLALSNYGPQ